MNGFVEVDFIILAVVVVSALVSLTRGFVKEAVSLAGWIAAVWLSFTFFESAAQWLAPHVSVPSARLGLGFLAIFIGTLLLTGIASYVAGVIVDSTGISGTDRVLGMLFGAARGIVIIALLVMAAGMTPIPQDPWWRASALLPQFERIAVQIRGALPEEVAQHLSFVPQ